MPDDLHIVVHGERKHVMTATDVKRSFPKNNVRFIRWRSAQRSINPLKDFLALGELYKILRRLKKKNLVDAVHLHSSKSGLLGRAACRMAGLANVVYTPNGAPFLSATNSVANYFYQQLERLGNSFGGQVVCCSESELEEYKRIGIDGYFVNNGIAVEKKVAGTPNPRRDKFRIITTGRIEKQKNPELFNNIARYFEEFDQFEFVWVGDGAARKTLTSKNIVITGWQTPETVKEELAQSDIYISTSVYEGLSFGVLEALSLRKPVLLSSCVGNKDVIKGGVNGDLFRNEAEAIIKILSYGNNRDMLPVMGEYSREICDQKFDLNQNFMTYRNIYQGNRLHLSFKGIQ
jgi:glycosyltransferase involved in cell wall biosynthesis